MQIIRKVFNNSFNRTIMELKCIIVAADAAVPVILLIVP